MYCVFFFFKQKTAYEMRISDWSSDVCSSDLLAQQGCDRQVTDAARAAHRVGALDRIGDDQFLEFRRLDPRHRAARQHAMADIGDHFLGPGRLERVRGRGSGDRKSTRMNSSH